MNLTKQQLFQAKHLELGESDISYLIGFAICDYYYFDSSIKLLLSTKVIAARGEDNHQLLPFKLTIVI